MNSSTNLADYPHRVTESVRFSETDQMGHVNNTVFGIYFEVGRSSYFSDHGFYKQDKVTLVIVKTEIQFRSMIYWPGSIEIGSRVTGSGRSSFTMDQILLQEEREVGSATSTMVVIDSKTHKATPIPDAIRNMLGL